MCGVVRICRSPGQKLGGLIKHQKSKIKNQKAGDWEIFFAYIKMPKKGSPKKGSPKKNCTLVGPTENQARRLEDQAYIANYLLHFMKKYHVLSATDEVTLEGIIQTSNTHECSFSHDPKYGPAHWGGEIKQQQRALNWHKYTTILSIKKEITGRKEDIAVLQSATRP